MVASHATPWAQLAERGYGLWVENSPESLAEAIEHMRSMPLAEMGDRGRQWMSAEFTWDAAAREVCNTYSMMLSGTPILADVATARESLATATESASRH